MRDETYPELEEGERFFIGGPVLYKVPLEINEIALIANVLLQYAHAAPVSNRGRYSPLRVVKKMHHYAEEIHRRTGKNKFKMGVKKDEK